MSYSIFTGKQRSLVFPIMCNGFLTIDYSADIANSADAIAYGLWALDEDFTFECVLTPYEINGYGGMTDNGHTYQTNNGNLTRSADVSSGDKIISNSKKIMSALSNAVYDHSTPTNYQTENYLSRNARLTHEMRIFHNTNFQVSLVNDTLHNQNNPAKYKIKVGIMLGTTMRYFTTDTLILPNAGEQYNYQNRSQLGGLNGEGKHEFVEIADRYITGVSGDTLTFNGSGINTFVPDGDIFEVFYKLNDEFVSLGTANTVTSTTLKLTNTPSITISTGAGNKVYMKNNLEPAYINNTFHIACSWDNANKTITIFFNGRPVKRGTHTGSQSFSIAQSDCFIGANGTGATGAGSATTNNQFMGELHELSIMNRTTQRITAINNLMPSFNETVLYLRFEEVDE